MGEYGVVYKVSARNFDYAVCDGKNGFIGVRYKFGDEFLDTEYDYEVGGTVRILEKMTNVPKDIDINSDSKELFNWLKNYEKLVQSD